jgi:polyphosphate kinase 2 (PPK2 family)
MDRQVAGRNGKLKRWQYEKELRRLQTELCRLQDWVKHTGMRVVVVFEGRDGAGKGGTIRAITERVSPRIFRVIALPAPSDRERSQMYMQRYMQHFPAAGEIVNCPEAERYMINGGIRLIKYWLEVSDREQDRRFKARMEDPLRQWKLSPMDLPSRSQWFAYSRARDEMLKATDSRHAPWHIVRSDDKKRARLNCISHLLSQIPYKKLPREKVKLPKRSMKGAYDDQATLRGRKFVPETY